jgi:hypothetical protein
MWSHCRIGAHAIIDESVLVDGTTAETGQILRGTVWTGTGPMRQQRCATYWGLEEPAAVSPPKQAMVSIAGI